MKAFLINPYDETITEVEGDFGANTRKPMYEQLTEPGKHEVDCITAVGLTRLGDVVYLDDNGHLEKGRACWAIAGYPSPLAGRGLVLGTDEEGGTRAPSARITLELLQREVTWLHMESTGEFGEATTDIIDTALGPAVRISTGQPRVKYPEEK